MIITFFITMIYKRKKRYNFIVHTVGYPLKINLVTPLLNLAEQNEAYNMIAYPYNQNVNNIWKKRFRTL